MLGTELKRLICKRPLEAFCITYEAAVSVDRGVYCTVINVIGWWIKERIKRTLSHYLSIT